MKNRKIKLTPKELNVILRATELIAEEDARACCGAIVAASRALRHRRRINLQVKFQQFCWGLPTVHSIPLFWFNCCEFGDEKQTARILTLQLFAEVCR